MLICVLNRLYGKILYISAERINFTGCVRKENEKWQEKIIQILQIPLENVEAIACLLKQSSIQTRELTGFRNIVQKIDNYVHLVKMSDGPSSTSENEKLGVRELLTSSDFLCCGDSKHCQRRSEIMSKL